jgi:putative membrane protein
MRMKNEFNIAVSWIIDKIEVTVIRNLFQKLLGLATIGTINRAKSVQNSGVDDVPLELAQSFYKWYMGRRNEIEIK